MPFAITLLAALLFQSIDDITGAWRGSVMHEGEVREVAVARGLVFAGGLDGVLYAFEP